MTVQAIWIGCAPANFTSGRRGFAPEAIVIHVMDGTLKGTDSWFGDRQAKVSAHYGVGVNGELHQYVHETDCAQHAGIVDRPSWPLLKPDVNPNLYTIGVEHEGRGDRAWPWPEAQLAASARLVAAICARWRIPMDAEHIVRHHEIRASKPCPGAHFDKADYLSHIRRIA